MVFVGGPRQVGKTTLALGLLGPQDDQSQANQLRSNRARETHPAYLNWDHDAHREDILARRIPTEYPLTVLDEIHKFHRWRSLVKGLYDTRKSTTKFLITGSAQLDFYRHGGDSLQGRYHYHRLHPLSLGELIRTHSAEPVAALTSLLKFGGFPEPLFRSEERFHRRWRRERMKRVLKDDLRDLENIRHGSQLEQLAQHLPSCVGSPLSIRSLRLLLQVAHATAEHWVAIFERLYLCFRISPYGAPAIRAVKKEQKLYLWDWSAIANEGARFENLVASQLLKYCHFREDTEGYAMELRFIRDTDKREIDFVVLQDEKPLFAVECKSGDRQVAPAARYFRERTPIPRFYQVHRGAKDYGAADTDVRVLPFTQFCKELALP